MKGADLEYSLYLVRDDQLLLWLYLYILKVYVLEVRIRKIEMTFSVVNRKRQKQKWISQKWYHLVMS